MIYYILGIFLGYSFWKFFAGKKEGDKKERSIIFYFGENSLHIHHWIIGAILLIILMVLNIKLYFILGVLTGSIIQGLTYRDRFVVFYKTKDYEKIYNQFK